MGTAPSIITSAVSAPWNASWTGESHYEVRPYRWAGGAPAIWQRHAPGEGRPIFAAPHMVRQRQSVAAFICTVCGERTPESDRYGFGLGGRMGEYFVTTEAPVHHACAQCALTVCSHLRAKALQPTRFPIGWKILAAMVAGDEVEKDFGLRIPVTRPVVGHLKFAWPIADINHFACPIHNASVR